jgi:hypothetical protein
LEDLDEEEVEETPELSFLGCGLGSDKVGCILEEH